MIVPYQFNAPENPGGEAHLYLLGDIVEDAFWLGETSPTSLQKQIELSGADNLVVHINSYGGQTSAGMAMYNILKNCGVSVTTVNDGFCCSAASLIFMAGKRRIMRNSSLLMIHNAWVTGTGNADELRALADDLEKISDTAANIYRENIKIDDEQLKALLDAESWIAPQEALDYGFATEIGGDEQHDAAYSSAFMAIKNAVLREKEPQKEPEPIKTPFQSYFKNFYAKEK